MECVGWDVMGSHLNWTNAGYFLIIAQFSHNISQISIFHWCSYLTCDFIYFVSTVETIPCAVCGIRPLTT